MLLGILNTYKSYLHIVLFFYGLCLKLNIKFKIDVFSISYGKFDAIICSTVEIRVFIQSKNLWLFTKSITLPTKNNYTLHTVLLTT